MTDRLEQHVIDIPHRHRLLNIFSGSVGNLVEYFDWAIYATFALYFAPAFFPESDQTAQLLNNAAIFAVGFIFRPLGGWLLGSLADRKGRKSALLFSVSLMCLGSLIIACTPGYAVIGGWWAPALLLFARMLQGFSIGDEYGSSATYLSEMATANRRGYYSSFQYVTIVLGQILALLSQPQSVESALFWYICALLIVSGYSSVNAIVKAELFPVHIRALGVGFPYFLTVAFFGGTAEYLALWMKSIGHPEMFAYYVSVCASLSLIVALTMKETMETSSLSDKK